MARNLDSKFVSIFFHQVFDESGYFLLYATMLGIKGMSILLINECHSVTVNPDFFYRDGQSVIFYNLNQYYEYGLVCTSDLNMP